MSDTPGKNSDIMVAVGAILCIGLGASVTYWLTHGGGPGQTVPIVVKEGRPIDSKPDVAAAKTAPPSVPAPQTTTEGEYLPVTFGTLSSYYYEIPNIEDPAATKVPKEQIPQPIKTLNTKKIAVQGFMVPSDLKNGKAQNFLLVKDQSLCCYGRMPQMNEWVSVRMQPGKSARVVLDQPVTVFGTFDVGEAIDKGEVLSIYRLNADDVAGPLDL